VAVLACRLGGDASSSLAFLALGVALVVTFAAVVQVGLQITAGSTALLLAVLAGRAGGHAGASLALLVLGITGVATLAAVFGVALQVEA
jgi:hypothetical protein